MRFVGAILAVLMLGACASSARVEPNMSRMYAEQGGSASVQVLGDDEIAPELGHEVKRLLRGARAYEVTDKPDGRARTQIEIYVTRVARVDRAQRVLLGPFGGPAKVTAQVVVRQQGKIVDSFLVDGRSSAGSPAAGTTDQALKLTAEKIAERLTS